MVRKISAKSRFEANWEKMHDARTTSSSALSEEEASSKTIKQLVREFRRPVRTAFKKARLDIRNDYHWKILLLTLAPSGLLKQRSRPAKKMVQQEASATREGHC
jgi:hypothetical protein